MKEIKTSQPDWLPQLAQSYKKKEDVQLVNDAGIKIDPRTMTLLMMGKEAKITKREWISVLISVGVGVAGAYLLVMAILDPEPYSKITAALITGAVLLGSGGFMGVRILTHIKPPDVKATPDGFEIHWN